MSKPISFGLSKSKISSISKPPPSFPSNRPQAAKRALQQHPDSDNEEEEPKHESVTGFTSGGAILSQPVQEKTERVIKNPGNADWRRRGQTSQNLLPPEVQRQREAERNGDVVMTERDVVSQESGLQLAKERSGTEMNDVKENVDAARMEKPAKPLTVDEEALQALLDNGESRPKSNAVIEVGQNRNVSARNEADDFKADVAARPDSSSLDDYAAMPVEEFGMAMLRGMGQKRRANGEIIKLDRDEPKDKAPKVRKQEGFLGIGAKPAPGTDFEIGAWGKADMRKNNRGQGFFTPVVLKNDKTGEVITEEELQRRVKETKDDGRKVEEDWRARRDRNLEKSGRDGRRHNRSDDDSDRSNYRDQMNDFSRHSSSSRRENGDTDRDRNPQHNSSQSRREGNNGREKDRDRDHERDREPNGYSSREHGSSHKDSERGSRHRRYDDDRYDSSSSHRSGHRDRDREPDRNRDRDKYSDSDRRHRDRR